MNSKHAECKFIDIDKLERLLMELLSELLSLTIEWFFKVAFILSELYHQFINETLRCDKFVMLILTLKLITRKDSFANCILNTGSFCAEWRHVYSLCIISLNLWAWQDKRFSAIFCSSFLWWSYEAERTMNMQYTYSLRTMHWQNLVFRNTFKKHDRWYP